MEVVLIVSGSLLLLAALIFIGFLVFNWWKVRGVSQASQQEQGAVSTSTKKLNWGSLGKALFFAVWAMVWLVVIAVVFFILSAIGSCVVEVATIPARITDSIEESRKEADEERLEAHRREERRKERNEEQKEQRKDVLKRVSRFLTTSYKRDEWNRLRLESVGPTERSVTFTVTPYTGVHLPPVDMALAPGGTLFFTEDKEYYRGGVLGRNLWIVYHGDKSHTCTPGGVHRIKIVECSLETPYYSLQIGSRAGGSRPEEGSSILRSTCKVKVVYPNEEAALTDVNTRLPLEKVFRQKEDFDRPVKIIDLPPEEIGGTPVYWDLVVRVYPAFRSSPRDIKGPGRWMPSKEFEAGYLDLFAPRLMIKETKDETESNKESEINPIWKDEEGLLLSSGSFMTSSEEMGDRIGYRPYGGQLFIEVPSDSKDPRGVTIRVVLRVRFQPRE